MHNSFIQKVMITAAIGFACASLIWMFRHVIVAADEAVNGKFKGSNAPRVVN